MSDLQDQLEALKKRCKQLDIEHELFWEYDAIDEDQAYAEMLNECYPMVDVCGFQYEPANALESLDPVAYRCGLADYISNELDDGWVEHDDRYYSSYDAEREIERLEALIDETEQQNAETEEEI
jgi:hypothetical protein